MLVHEDLRNPLLLLGQYNILYPRHFEQCVSVIVCHLDKDYNTKVTHLCELTRKGLRKINKSVGLLIKFYFILPHIPLLLQGLLIYLIMGADKSAQINYDKT